SKPSGSGRTSTAEALRRRAVFRPALVALVQGRVPHLGPLLVRIDTTKERLERGVDVEVVALVPLDQLRLVDPEPAGAGRRAGHRDRRPGPRESVGPHLQYDRVQLAALDRDPTVVGQDAVVGAERVVLQLLPAMLDGRTRVVEDQPLQLPLPILGG